MDDKNKPRGHHRETDLYFAGRIRQLSGDKEQNHKTADDDLCALLEDLGYVETVRAFRELPKWYS